MPSVKFDLGPAQPGVRSTTASRAPDGTCASVWPDMAAPASLSIPHATYPLAAHPDALPLVVEARGDRTATALAGWCKANATFVADALSRHGAILFRDFDVPDAPAFEQVARAIDDDLKCDYLGTSPRDALTGYVFTASELPSYYPIPQH